MAKQVYECNWVPSRVTGTQLNNLVLIGALSSKNTIHWRVPGKECPPTPREGEVVVFVDHLARGFKPPGSKFYRDVLADFQLHPQDTGPNSVTNMCHFQVLCEVFFQEEPTVELFRDLFHLNRRTEFTDGSNTELGGVAFRKGKRSHTLTPNCIATPKNGIRHGSTAKTPPLLVRIPCLAFDRSGSATHTLLHKD